MDTSMNLLGNSQLDLFGENEVCPSPGLVSVVDQDQPHPVEFSSQELFSDSQLFNEEDNAFSQGTLDFITGVIAGELPQAVDNSFNLARLDDQVQRLSQGDGIEEFEFSYSQGAAIPPSSPSSDDNSEEERFFSIIGTEEFDEETGYFGGVPASGQTSSQESSQGDGLPALTNYPGKYNFSVNPSLQLGGKKWMLDTAENRIYCPKNVDILFKFGLDFSVAPMKSLTIEAMLVFSSNAFMNTAVPRCNICYDEEVKSSGATDVEIYRHVLRCSHPRAKYLQNEKNERWYVTVPLEKPQLGEETILRNYKFTCWNSCKHGGINRRDIAIMFLLKEGTKQVGRSCFHVKVCTGPSRDYKKDVKKHEEGDKRAGKRKGDSCASAATGDEAGTSEPHDSERSSKHGRLSQNENETTHAAADPRNVDSADTAPGPSRPKKKIEEQDSEEICNSQDELVDTFLEHLHSNVKLAVAGTKNVDPKHSVMTKNAIHQLKVFQKSMDYYRDHVLEPQEAIEEEEADDEAQDPPEPDQNN